MARMVERQQDAPSPRALVRCVLEKTDFSNAVCEESVGLHATPPPQPLAQ